MPIPRDMLLVQSNLHNDWMSSESIQLAKSELVGVCWQAFIVPAILKYVDNIADLYAHAGAVLITAFFSWIFFDLKPTIFFMLGMLASVCSLFLYYSERLIPQLAGEDPGPRLKQTPSGADIFTHTSVTKSSHTSP